MAIEKNFPAILGDTIDIDFELNDADGKDINLAGATVQLILARADIIELILSTDDSPASLEISVDSPSHGNGIATITPAAQAGIEPEPYNYDLRVVLVSDKVTTQAYGKIFFQAGLLSWPPASQP